MPAWFRELPFQINELTSWKMACQTCATHPASTPAISLAANSRRLPWKCNLPRNLPYLSMTYERSFINMVRRHACMPYHRVILSLLMLLGGWMASTHGSIIPATNPGVVDGLSALNWVVKDGSVSSTVGGASFTLAFPGTRRVALCLDTMAMEKWTPSRCPVIAWSVNGGPRQTHQLQAAEPTVVLAENFPDPQIDFYLLGFSPFEDRYNGDHPVNSVRITGFEVDEGGRAAALPPARQTLVEYWRFHPVGGCRLGARGTRQARRRCLGCQQRRTRELRLSAGAPLWLRRVAPGFRRLRLWGRHGQRARLIRVARSEHEHGQPVARRALAACARRGAHQPRRKW